MSNTQIIFYKERSGRVPALEWLQKLSWKDRRGFAKCFTLVQYLSHSGRDLRRPSAAHLRDGIHELRARVGRVNYRILFFFFGSNQAVLVHGLTKEAAVSTTAIERSIRRKIEFEQDPTAHTHKEPTP